MVKIILLSLPIIGLLVSPATWADCSARGAPPGQYLVRLSPQFTAQTEAGTSLAIARALTHGQSVKLLHDRSQIVSRSFSTADASSVPPSLLRVSGVSDPAALSAEAGVLSVEPDCYIDLSALPDDPLYSSQWALASIDAPSAWNLISVAPVLIAVSDNGVDYEHPDLAQNIFLNDKEATGIIGYDDDNNGCIDDLHGCDLADMDGDPRPGTGSLQDHGTHVAGIIGAAGNNSIGVSGVAWQSRLIIAKGFSDYGEATISDLLATVYYAVNMGARVINCSWGGSFEPTQAERDAFSFAIRRGLIPVVAAGNDSEDVAATSPSGIEEVITVGASNSLNQVSTFSNWGLGIDLLAPGGDRAGDGHPDEYILSTSNSGSLYKERRGTSMSAPFVSGVIGLMLSINPNLTLTQVRQILIETGFIVSGSDRSYPRLNAYLALEAAQKSLSNNTNSEEPPPCDPNIAPCPSTGPAPNSPSGSGPSAGCGLLPGASGVDTAGFSLWTLFLLLPAILALSFRFFFRGLL